MRYVDDLFLAFDNPNDGDFVYQQFNSIHPNLKFTKEEEKDKKLSFWVFQILKRQTGSKRQYNYKKPTF